MDIKGALVVALIVFVGNHGAFAKRGYMITAPRVYRAGITEKLRVQLFDTKDVWNVSVKLVLGSGKQGRVVATATGQYSLQIQGLLELKVADKLNIVRKGVNGKLFVSVATLNGASNFTENRPVMIESRGPSLFIQTDKPIYKPGQKVRMRIIGTDSDLKPLAGKVKQVSVSTPTNIRLMQWDNKDFVDGIVSLEMLLSKQPVLGNWKIKAEAKGIRVTQTIKIDKYVLPKFQVIINPPSFIAIDSKEVTGTICATYTYGQPVNGILKASFKIERRWWWSHINKAHAAIEITKAIKGCADFRLSNKDLGLFDMRHNYYGTSLNIKAIVTEEATGISRNATSAKVDIVPYRIKLEFTSDTTKRIKPGLPYQGRLKVATPDGVPVSGEKVTIMANSNSGIVYKKLFVVTNGLVEFSIDNVPTGATYLSIDARHGSGSVFGYDYGRYNWYASTGLYARPWYSPSNSFLSIDRRTKPTRVGRKARITYKFTAKGLSSPITVYHSVMCKGELMNTGNRQQEIKLVNSVDKPLTTEATTTTSVENSTSFVLPTATDDPLTRNRVALTPRKNAMASGSFKLKVTQAMVPSCRLLVYYVRRDGETVADSMKIDVEDKLENQVTVRFDDKVKKPGQGTRLFLQAAPGSRVAIAAVDKSVHLLRAANELTESKIISALEKLDVGPTWNYRTKRCHNNWHPWGRPVNRRRRTSVHFEPLMDDSSKAFNDAGMIYITNLIIESAKCPQSIRYNYRMLPMAVSERSNGGMGQGRPGPSPRVRENVVTKKRKNPVAPKSKIRQEFPETWLWTEETVDKRTGKKVINATVPDTITSWYASAFAMSKNSGIGVASPTSLTAFQPFFVSLTLPYSVIRGEELTVITTVFNYMSSCMTIQVDLETTEDFQLTSGSNSSKLCVCGNEAKSVNFTIVAKTLGRIPLTVTGKDVQESVCKNVSNEASIGVIDTVRRKLLVEPEGVRKEYTFSKLICPEDFDNGSVTEIIKLTLPKRVVPGSVYATLSAIGDLMGPALAGLDNLLRMPTGCGEQNMVNFAPNIYVMQYLNSTRQLTDAIKKKATEFLQIGYQRELTYKRKDGSYSAFGNDDKEGSLWLTAFVLRSFAQARPFIYVDPKELQHSVEWLKKKQRADGCFPRHGKLFHKAMKGGVATPVSLTAFTVLALIEAGVNPKDETIKRAMDQCIRPRLHEVKDAYSLALLAYSFTIAKHSSRDKIFKRLKRKTIVEGDMMHWENEDSRKNKSKDDVLRRPYYRAPAADIEMTSYALMASIASGSRVDMLRAIPIVRWLSTQRNGLGGFHSTQDTCVGLQSLAQYAALAYGDKIMLRIDVQGRFRHSFRIENHDSLVLKRVELPPHVVPSELMLNAVGFGCAVVQADVSYHVPDVSEEPAFHLTVDIRQRTHTPALRTETGGKLCAPLEMHVCTRWLKDGASNMAIVKVKLVSGFKADEESLDSLRNLPSLAMMRFETEGQDVNLYFDQITSVCFSFDIFQETLVKNTKPAPVTVYDYYEPELSATTMYNITKEVCQEGRCPVCTKSVADVKSLGPKWCRHDFALIVRKAKNGVKVIDVLPEVFEKVSGEILEKIASKPKRSVSMPSDCACPMLSQRQKKLLVLINTNNLEKDRLILDGDSVLVPYDHRLVPLLRRCPRIPSS